MRKLILCLAVLFAVKAGIAQNPNVILPEGTYPYWPAYNHLSETDLKYINAQEWKNNDHVIEGWDWSLPNFVKQSPRSSVGLQRNIGWDNSFMRFELPFTANPVGLLWVKWRDIEKTKDNFDFTPLINRIKQANSVGTQISLRILCHSKSRGSVSGEAPVWLEDLGVTFLPQEKPGDNLNFDPAHPKFHERYLKLISELSKTEIPGLVKNAYVGYASHSFGDEGIGPYGETNSAANDTVKHVRERLDAWEKAFKGMETKVYMGGSCDYGFKKGFGTRRGFVEMYLYRIPNIDMGQYVDSNGYLCVDETAPIIRYKCFHGEVNEEYESAWATSDRDFRFGNSTISYPYRYFTSTLRALQMRCTYIHTTGHLVPEMLPFLSLELGRTVEDTPDVWTFLRTSYLRASSYQNNDYLNRPITAAEQAEGIETKNFERWLYQRDAPGYETQPAIKIQQAIKMWMVQEDKYYDYIARSGKKLGFDIDERWIAAQDSVALKVTYFDDYAGEMNLICKNGEILSKKTQTLFGDGKLKTTTFFLPGIKANSLPYNFDFALEAGINTEKIVVSIVRLIQAVENPGTVDIIEEPVENNPGIMITYNPAHNLVSVNSQYEIRQIEMYDISGKQMKSVSRTGNNYDLNTTGFTPGIYLFWVQDMNGNVRAERTVLK
ncbi:MAG: T9SS type A sorting domain-containing protein [Bacteroidales bacterium]|nr:T9SS type A sorting domain-containing protein [Bacteroidales bacterium]